MAEVPFFDLAAIVRSRSEHLHAALDSVVQGGYFVGGEPVAEFERSFADYLGARECIGVGNGLDALRIGMEGLGIGPGDEVIVPGFTFYATWLAVLQVGAVPVFADVELDTAALDLAAAASLVTERTKAVVAVHLYGIPADLVALRRFADERGLFLIEDAAQSHGARSGELMTGTAGDFSAFSFYPTKNLGALGDAGAVVTDSAELAAVVRRRRSYGQGTSKYDHIDTGWNSRIDTLQAAFLQDALPQLDSQNERRRQIAAAYLGSLGDRTAGVIGRNSLTDSVWHHFVIRATDRDALRAHLAAHGVASDVHYPYSARDLAPLASYVDGAQLPSSERLSREVVSLPMGPWMTEEQVRQVGAALADAPQGLLAGD